MDATQNEVSKSKRFLLSVLAILVIWSIARVIPGIVKAYSSNLAMLISLLVLPLGWKAACAISKGRVPSSVNANLYIFVAIEAVGLLEVLMYIGMNLANSTGRYSTDSFGIAYSDYPFLFGKVILVEAVYIAICIYLAKKTPRIMKDDQSTNS